MTADQTKNASALPITRAHQTSVKLTPYQQQVIELRNQGLTFRAIAERLGRNVSNVHRTHKRAMANLERQATEVDLEAMLAKWNKEIAAKGPVTDKSLLADLEEIIGLLIFFLRENTVAPLGDEAIDNRRQRCVGRRSQATFPTCEALSGHPILSMSALG